MTPTQGKGKNTFLIISLVIIVILFNVFQQIYTKESEKDNEKKKGKPTSHDTGKNGHKALYLLLAKLGHDVSRFKGEVSELKREKITNMVIISPYQRYLDDKTANQIYKWVSEGNQLTIIDEGYNPFWELLGIKAQPKLVGEGITLTKFKGSKLTEHVKSIGPVGFWRLSVPEGNRHYQVLLSDDHGVIAVRIKAGKGSVKVLIAPNIVANQQIDKNDNIILLANLFADQKETTLVFNESVHGFGRSEFSFSPVTKTVFSQLGFTLFLFYLVFLIRFGKARPLIRDTVRASKEYIESLANLFAKAQAKDYTVRNLLRNFARRTSKTTGTTSILSIEKVFDTIKENRKKSGEQKELKEQTEVINTVEQIIEQAKDPKKINNLSNQELIGIAVKLQKGIKRIHDSESQGVERGSI